MAKKGNNANNTVSDVNEMDPVLSSFNKASAAADKKREEVFDGAKVNADLTKAHIDRGKFSDKNNDTNLPGNPHRANSIDNTKTSGSSKNAKLRNKIQGVFFDACAIGTAVQSNYNKAMKSLNRKLKNVREVFERYGGNVQKDFSYYMAKQKEKAIERKKERKSLFKEGMDGLLKLAGQSYNDFQRALQLQTIQDMPSSADIRGRSMAVVTGDVVPSGELYAQQDDKKDDLQVDQGLPSPV